MTCNRGKTYLHTKRRLEKRTHAKAHEVERRVLVPVIAEHAECADQVVGKEQVKAVAGDTETLCGIYAGCHGCWGGCGRGCVCAGSRLIPDVDAPCVILRLYRTSFPTRDWRDFAVRGRKLKDAWRCWAQFCRGCLSEPTLEIKSSPDTP